MQVFSVSHSRDGWAIELVETPAWALVFERLVGNNLCAITGHLFCNPPMWTYRIGWGERYEPEDGQTTGDPKNSLGFLLYRAVSWGDGFSWTHRKRNLLIPISAEQAARWAPDFVEEMAFLDNPSADLTVSADAARWAPDHAGQ